MLDEYKTKDLPEAGYIFLHCNLLRLENAGNFYYFVFSPKSQAEKLKYEFWQSKGTVTPKEYADALRDLKRLVFSS